MSGELKDQERLIIWHNGDPSVGLNGDRIFVDVDLSPFGEADRPEYFEQVKEALRQAMAEVWEFQTGAMSLKDAESFGAPVNDPVDVIGKANEMLAQAGLPTYSQALSALSGAKPFVDAAISQSDAKAYPLAYDYNLSRLVEVNQVLNAVRSYEASGGVSAESQSQSEGFVLAFPGASVVERDELMGALRATGAQVFPVDFAISQSVLVSVDLRRSDEPEVGAP